MKVAVLHLTDIHISQTNDWVLDKPESIVKAIRPDIAEAEKTYIVVSGDIANTGKQEEYDIAKEFLLTLKEKFLAKDLVQPEFVLVPGNHDCNFELEDQTRKTMIKEGVDYEKIGNSNSSIVNSCIEVQRPFWDFFYDLTGYSQEKLFFQKEDELRHLNLRFNCFNTAWISNINEKPGDLFFPIQFYDEKNLRASNKTLTISVFHHPFNWLTPKTKENNKKEFKEFLEKTSSLFLYGHEHYDSGESLVNDQNDLKSHYFSGKALQNKNDDNGFKILTFDEESLELLIKDYVWSEDYFMSNPTQKLYLNESEITWSPLLLNDSFKKFLNHYEIPINIGDKKDVNLLDLFVYPDLESRAQNENHLENWVDASNILGYEKNFNYVFIEGRHQSGKTALIKGLYLDFYHQKSKFPLFLEGNDFKNKNLENILLKAFKNQYYNEENEFDIFKQLDKQEKVLFIDNPQNLKINIESFSKIIGKLKKEFGKIIITSDSSFTLLPGFESYFDGFDFFDLIQLGHKKRDDLIENYHKLNNPELSESDLLQKKKESLEKVNRVVGKRIIPSYPIFIISILQTLDYAKPVNLEQTSFGYCYQSLIHIALAYKAKVKNEHIDSYFNFLSEFCYHLYKEGVYKFDVELLESFHQSYSKDFLIPGISEILDNLKKSKIIIEEDSNEFRFCYDYIFYFLVARKFSEMLEKNEGKSEIKTLFENLEKEENANILVFIAHHSRDDYLIEEATFSTMIQFEKLSPISLETGDKFYQLIEGVANEIKDDIIEANRDPKRERRDILGETDKQERAQKGSGSENGQGNGQGKIDEEIININKSLRSIEILGQIIRNRKGSIKKDYLVYMIKELYFTCFRTINYFGENIQNTKEQITELVNQEIRDESRKNIEDQLKKYLNNVSFQVCLSLFSKIIYSVGDKDMKKLFDQVSEEIGTPAAQLVTFSINSCYNKVSLDELKTLKAEFERNPVAHKILVARIRSYVYQNFLHYKEEQQIANALNLKIKAPNYKKS